MKSINGHTLGVTAAATGAVIYTAYGLWMYFAANSMIDMSAALFYLNSFGPLTPFFDINAQIFVSGLVQTSVYSYIYAYVFAYMYNHISKKL